MGCRGPDKICPGLGAGGAAGTGRAAMVGARLTMGGFNRAPGADPAWPDASGGRSGNAERRSGTGGAATSAAAASGALFSGRAPSETGLSIIGRGASRTAADGIRLELCFSCTGAAGAGGMGSVDSTRTPIPAVSLPPSLRRSCSTTSSSSELECVFLSVTPSSGSMSMTMPGFTSSSRANSFMRILLIRCGGGVPQLLPRFELNLSHQAKPKPALPETNL